LLKVSRFISRKTGDSVILAGEIARGGEGAVYGVQGASNTVAKIYLQDLPSQKADKLTAMSGAVSDSLIKIAAWPVDVVGDQRGTVRGFLMPRINSRVDIHQLYSPKSRATRFPDADFRFIAHVASNVARAFATVHAAGHVIGDINHGHMLIGADGRVVLIDADSFQVAISGRVFTCDVGTPLFTAPEIQDRPFRGLVRTQNHDLFGLAVMLFHLLYLGRHPYAGVWRGTGEMPIERAIKEGRFAYGINAIHAGMQRPPNTIALATLGANIAQLFERAFAAPPPSVRPSAVDWLAELEALRSALRPCEQTTAHYYPRHLSACPWCEVERTAFIRLFGQKIEVVGAGAIDVGALWAAIERVPRPSADPLLPSQITWLPPAGANLPVRGARLLRQAASVIAAVIGLVGCASESGANGSLLLAVVMCMAAYFIWPRVSEAKRRELNQISAAARGQWDQLLARWNREASVKAFDATKDALASAKSSLIDLPNERTRRMARLRSEQHDFQRRRYLDRFRIEHAKISGIGTSRAATLAAFGIETALDIMPNAIMTIQGFGPKLTGELLAWRRAHEAKFRFNPAEPIAPSEIARVEAEIAAQRNTLLQSLRQGANTLARLSQEIPAARVRVLPALTAAWDTVQITERRQNAI
jgi:DNA-binding helix-hairpin-helix protein with protein kinase domain